MKHLAYVERSYGGVKFEVFTAETMNSAAFWDMTPHGACKNRPS
jgi:hypothetical protein